MNKQKYLVCSQGTVSGGSHIFKGRSNVALCGYEVAINNRIVTFGTDEFSACDECNQLWASQTPNPFREFNKDQLDWIDIALKDLVYNAGRWGDRIPPKELTHLMVLLRYQMEGDRE